MKLSETEIQTLKRTILNNHKEEIDLALEAGTDELAEKMAKEFEIESEKLLSHKRSIFFQEKHPDIFHSSLVTSLRETNSPCATCTNGMHTILSGKSVFKCLLSGAGVMASECTKFTEAEV